MSNKYVIFVVSLTLLKVQSTKYGFAMRLTDFVQHLENLYCMEPDGNGKFNDSINQNITISQPCVQQSTTNITDWR